MEQLPCQDKTELFYPEDTSVAWKSTQKAKALCASCPKVMWCLELALKDKEQYGIWGGATVKERLAIKKDPRQKAIHIKKLMEEHLNVDN